MADNTVARALHDIGLATWFGGSLMGAVGVNGASQEVTDPKDRIRVANAGWGRFTPVNLLGIAAYTLGSVQLTRANSDRLQGQAGVATVAGIKTIVSVLAGAATLYARILGQKLMEAEADAARSRPLSSDLGAEDAVTPGGSTPPDVASAQSQLKLFQWVIPALTGLALVVNAKMGEQQRPENVASGLARRLNPFD